MNWPTTAWSAFSKPSSDWVGKRRRWRPHHRRLCGLRLVQHPTTGSYIDGVQAGSYNDLGETLTFDGLVTRLELRY